MPSDCAANTASISNSGRGTRPCRRLSWAHPCVSFFFFLNDPAPPKIYPLPLPAALPTPLWHPGAVDHRPPHRQIDRVALIRVLAIVEETVDRQRACRAGTIRVRQQHIERGRKLQAPDSGDRKSTRLNSSHLVISYAVFCL